VGQVDLQHQAVGEADVLTYAQRQPGLGMNKSSRCGLWPRSNAARRRCAAPKLSRLHGMNGDERAGIAERFGVGPNSSRRLQ
jgi:hypothetical protein